jgi:hypothetical protein
MLKNRICFIIGLNTDPLQLLTWSRRRVRLWKAASFETPDAAVSPRRCVGVYVCGCFGNICTSIYCVLYCLYFVFCIVPFMYIYSYLFCLYLCMDYCRVIAQLQLEIIIIIMPSLLNLQNLHAVKDYLTNSMQQTLLLEKQTSSFSQVFRILWNPEGHYRIHKNTSRVPTFS